MIWKRTILKRNSLNCMSIRPISAAAMRESMRLLWVTSGSCLGAQRAFHVFPGYQPGAGRPTRGPGAAEHGQAPCDHAGGGRADSAAGPVRQWF